MSKKKTDEAATSSFARDIISAVLVAVEFAVGAASLPPSDLLSSPPSDLQKGSHASARDQTRRRMHNSSLPETRLLGLRQPTKVDMPESRRSTSLEAKGADLG